MSESSQHSHIAKLIQEIIEASGKDPTRLDVAIANFQSLVKAMSRYALAPRYYNTALEEANTLYVPPGQPNIPPQERSSKDPYKYPVVGQLEKIFGRKLKQTELQELGKILAQKIGLKLDRETKRSKQLLIQWFSNNWATLHMRIYEFDLPKMSFKK